jgi:hypothetical protein
MKMLTARAFILNACVLSSFGSLCIVLCTLVNPNYKRLLIILAKIVSFIGLMLGIVGVSVGISFVLTDDTQWKLGVASILSIIALVFNLIGVIASIIIK